MGDVTTKQEALQKLSTMLRNKALDDLTYVRLLTFFVRLQGWIR
jgi:hypothetical protein